VVLILISSVIAYPVAWFGIRMWLEGFAEKISIGPLIYIIASLLGLATGWLSIIYQHRKQPGIIRQKH
jgi:putative ABC transport system permease protein